MAQNNSGKIPPLTAAEAAQALGVKVYTIGIGIRGKAPYPVVDQFGQKHYQYMDVDVDEDTLTKIAQKTNGKYYRADSADTLRRIYADIDRLEKSEVEVKKYQHYDELFGQVGHRRAGGVPAGNDPGPDRLEKTALNRMKFAQPQVLWVLLAVVPRADRLSFAGRGASNKN